MPHICVSELGQHLLFGAKTLSEPMLDNFQLNSWEQISMTFESEFIQESAFENAVCQIDGPFFLGGGRGKWDKSTFYSFTVVSENHISASANNFPFCLIYR